MSGIGYAVGSPQYAAEASIGPAREASVPKATGGFQWDGGTLIAPPTDAPGGMTVNQILDSRMPPPSQEALEREALKYRLMMTYSRESILKERIRLLEKAMLNIEPKS